MTITATELKMNLGKYLKVVFNEDVFITKNGKIIAQLSLPQQNKMEVLSSLVGFVKADNDIDLETIREERLKRQ